MRIRYEEWLRTCLKIAVLAAFASPADAAGRFVPGDFATIQAAIDASSSGDTVTVDPGTYIENLVLKTGVDVRGSETARTILEPGEAGKSAILANGIDDVTFGNFTIANAQIGINVLDSTNLQIVNSVFDAAAQFGIQVDVESQVDILNSVFWQNSVAITRATNAAQVTNSGFVGNAITISSPAGILVGPDESVDNCGFFDNADLEMAGVDTPLGNNPVVGNPLFVDTGERDFHLREGSPFINAGIGTDAIDNTVADIGAYGGQFADPMPFPLAAPDVSDASATAAAPYSARITWSENASYLVTNTTNPGSYRLYYSQNHSGPPYDGTDAGNGTQPSPIDAGTATTITLADMQPAVPPPVSPQLVSANPRNGAVELNWSAVAQASAYQVYWGVMSVDEHTIDVGNVTAYTVIGLNNGTTYLFAVSASRQPVYHFSVTAVDSTQNQNQSSYSPESTLALGPFTESPQSNQLSAAPAVTVPYPDLPDKGCFVATAAFGADWAAEVQVLRDFRDRYLLKSSLGRVLVAWYYRHGPALARLVADNEALKLAVRVSLLPLVLVALISFGATMLAVVWLALLTSGLLILIGRRRGARPAVIRRQSS